MAYTWERLKIEYSNGDIVYTKPKRVDEGDPIKLKKIVRYYQVSLPQSSVPLTNPPNNTWVTDVSTILNKLTDENYLYYVDLFLYTDDTYSYSEVKVDIEISSAYKSVKTAIAANALSQQTAQQQQKTQKDLDNLKLSVQINEQGVKVQTKDNKFAIIIGRQSEEDTRPPRVGFLQNGQEVAYIDNNQLYIQNATILTSIKLGKFAFTPDDATSNLYFGKVE